MWEKIKHVHMQYRSVGSISQEQSSGDILANEKKVEKEQRKESFISWHWERYNTKSIDAYTCSCIFFKPEELILVCDSPVRGNRMVSAVTYT